MKHRKDLSDSERQCFGHNSIRQSSDYWLGTAGSAVSKYNEQRQNGWRKWTKSAESAAEAAGHFMQGFEPLLSVAANAGPEVGAAIGLVSGFFAIAAARSKTNDLIAHQMATILDRLPGFQMLETIYSEADADQAHLRRKIVLAYYSVLDFSILASRYYLRSGLRRWWTVLSSPTTFTDAADEAQKRLSEVRYKSEELLVWTVHDVRGINRKLQRDNEEKSILMVKDILGLSSWSKDNQKQKLLGYQRELFHEENDSGLLEWMSHDKIIDFRQQQVFFDWEVCPTSEMLLLLAGTDSRLGPFIHCWMSPIALAIIRELSEGAKFGLIERGKCELVFCILDVETRTSVHDIMSELLLGLLSAQRSFQLPDLLAKLDAYRSVRQTGNEREKKKALKDAVATVVGLLKAQLKVCVVIDRVDRCKEQSVLFEVLIDIMESANERGCCIKILTVANASFWDLDQEKEKDLAEHSLVRLFTATRDLPLA